MEIIFLVSFFLGFLRKGFPLPTPNLEGRIDVASVTKRRYYHAHLASERSKDPEKHLGTLSSATCTVAYILGTRTATGDSVQFNWLNGSLAPRPPHSLALQEIFCSARGTSNAARCTLKSRLRKLTFLSLWSLQFFNTCHHVCCGAPSCYCRCRQTAWHAKEWYFHQPHS